MSSTRYHLTADQTWMRCRAVKRKGQGVSLCPIGDRAHVTGRQGIAAQGGGVEVRTENGVRVSIHISAIDKGGTFTADTQTGRRSVYNADGLVMKLRDRAQRTATEVRESAAKTASDEKWGQWRAADEAAAVAAREARESKGREVIELIRQAPLARTVNEAYMKATAVDSQSSLERAEKVALFLAASDALTKLNGYSEPNAWMSLDKGLATLWLRSQELRLPKVTQTTLHDAYKTAWMARGRRDLPSLLGTD